MKKLYRITASESFRMIKVEISNDGGKSFEEDAFFEEERGKEIPAWLLMREIDKLKDLEYENVSKYRLFHFGNDEEFND